jgi:hypothetical protein
VVAASASLPSTAIIAASAKPIAAWAERASTIGHARVNSWR